jgi:hypothetical protein
MSSRKTAPRLRSSKKSVRKPIFVVKGPGYTFDLTPPVRLGIGRKRAEEGGDCAGKECGTFDLHVENLSVTDIEFDSLSVLGCCLITKKAFKKALTENVNDYLKLGSNVKCGEGCRCKKLFSASTELNIRNKRFVVYVSRTGDLLPKDEADCEVQFTITAKIKISTSVGVCEKLA